MTKSRPARFLASVFIVAFASLAMIFVLEFVVRWAVPAFDPSGHVRIVAGDDEHPNLGPPNTQQRQIKNTGDFDVEIRFNKYGLRDDRDLAQSSRNDYFAVGDSISFGWGVKEEERVTEQLEKIIGRPVYNISIPGDLNISEKLVAYAEKNGAKIGNLIVFFGTEVRMRNYDAPRSTQATQPFILKQWFRVLKVTLMETSALYFLFTSFIHQNPILKDIAVEAGLINPNLEGFPIHTFDAQVIVSTAKRLARFAEVEDRRVTIVVLPMRTLWIGPSQKTEDRIWQTLIARLRELNLDVLDLRPHFEAGGRPFQFFFKNDGHWNPKGHAMVGRAVALHLGFDVPGRTR